MNQDPRKKTDKMNSLLKKIRHPDLVIASFLLLLTLFTRIPFANKMLHQGDSARFAMAMKQFDVSQMRPHAPGYILYIASAELLDLFVHDERTSMVLVSILASAFTLFAFYYLSSQMFGRNNGIISSLLFISSPLFWFNGEMPLTYALEGLFCVIFAFCCYKFITGEQKWLVISAIILGLATGVRQNLIVMFLPLWIFAIRKYSIKKIFISMCVLGITCLVWFVPMVALTGGLGKYLASVNAQFTTWVSHPISLLYQIKVRGSIFASFMLYSLSFGILPMFYYFGQFFRIPSIIKDFRKQLILLWFVPPLLFFIGVNVFNSGHVLIILPPLFIFMTDSLQGFSKDLEVGAKEIYANSVSILGKGLRVIFSYKFILVASVILLLFINLHIFLFQNTQVSYSAIKKGDIRLKELIKLTMENSAPDKTMILTFLYNTQAGFYLPKFLVYCPFPLMYNESEVPIEAQNIYISFNHQTNPKTYWIPTGFRIKPIPVPEGIDTLIVWEDDIVQYYKNPSRPLREISSSENETRIYILKVKPGEEIMYDYHFWSVK